MSLMKRFDKMVLKTPASGILSTVQQKKKYGLTPVLEDLAELDISSKKKASKDDFEVLLRTG
jgi:hypothetical protein